MKSAHTDRIAWVGHYQQVPARLPSAGSHSTGASSIPRPLLPLPNAKKSELPAHIILRAPCSGLTTSDRDCFLVRPTEWDVLARDAGVSGHVMALRTGDIAAITLLVCAVGWWVLLGVQFYWMTTRCDEEFAECEVVESGGCDRVGSRNAGRRSQGTGLSGIVRVHADGVGKKMSRSDVLNIVKAYSLCNNPLRTLYRGGSYDRQLLRNQCHRNYRSGLECCGRRCTAAARRRSSPLGRAADFRM